ncbi:EscU/YscU/HrcU family type III secretion system export apparatus switch protein [Peptococcaceae bacterium]|nr:EscU/YscU/HrcU family type III secretion system export apparatus switch protein [Peptococcaceae bacterium]
MRKIAAALKYNQNEINSAPKVVAAGYGVIADKIKQIAEIENIPIYQDKVLAQALADLGTGAEIPPELYQVVAKILVEISRLDKQQGLE